MVMSNAAHAPYAVPYKLSFGEERRADGSRIEVMGWGNAGWTLAHFQDGPTALAFAEAVPALSRMPCHARLLARLAEHAPALEALRGRGRG
jgi:hypothetical protein